MHNWGRDTCTISGGASCGDVAICVGEITASAVVAVVLAAVLRRCAVWLKRPSGYRPFVFSSNAPATEVRPDAVRLLL